MIKRVNVSLAEYLAGLQYECGLRSGELHPKYLHWHMVDFHVSSGRSWNDIYGNVIHYSFIADGTNYYFAYRDFLKYAVGEIKNF